ncbi:disease resistance protein RGA4-like [Aegilops tauschii subsp. strangulata]|uniref:disease resistance protein RGA4-like n=1 Tax=Aegilops tauschii subsp. strangulata TaxID=200361 RepID=UPI00098BAFFD|nr:disease resistance protein RGA4-like [Aegilops tauschii subsp. strangulata]
MEAAVVSALMTNIVAKLLVVLDKISEQLSGLAGDIKHMQSELSMIAGDMEDHLSQKAQPSDVQDAFITRMRDLAFDIEDCLDQFLPCGACDGEPMSIGDQVDFSKEIQKLKKQLEDAHQQKTNYGVKIGSQQQAAAGQLLFLADDDASAFEDHHHHVGIEKPKQELLELLDGESEKMIVISIVGFGGSGKTALAKAVYHCPQVRRKFLHRAWAVASKHKDDAKQGILRAIVQQLLPSVAPDEIRTKQAAQLQELLRERLGIARTRCLIVIDDIEKLLWEALKPIFCAVKSITLLVTTNVQSVANACSSGDGYVYNMRNLGKEESKTLLKNKVSFFRASSPDSEDGSDAIVRKCLGHPLALVSVANHLLDEKELTGQFCQDTCRRLGIHMDENKNDNFTKLRQVLMTNYSSLPAGSSLKTCLLYTSLFPDGRPVSRKTLTRRWLAEGYIEGRLQHSDLEVAEENLKKLTDRNIILPVDSSNNGKAKTCKPHGIMHHFMLHRSMSSNFIAKSFGAKNQSNYRHLVIENHTNGTASSNDHHGASSSHGHLNKICTHVKKNLDNTGSANKMRPRSITVFGSAGEAVHSNLTGCKLLRVLDLKDCNDFGDAHVDNIYKLLHLKYLTLGSSVSNLPVKMKKLHCLETLDLRKTKIETLPLEIISLPHLAHLFGKIKLKRVSAKNRKNFNLQTLAGVVVDSNSGFPELMVHMKKLTKVKIWCEITSTDSNHAMLSEAIHKFAQAGTDISVGPRSLSLHLNNSSKDLLHQGDSSNATSSTPGYLSSLKLQGGLSQFPQFVMSLRGLKELCLTYTNMTVADLLPGLRKLPRLVCLKLVEVGLADLDIKDKDLPSLQRLCIVVENPKFPTIKDGALPRLVSLQLLCEHLVGLCGVIKVEGFEALQEIALDSMVNQPTIQLWENEAKKHPKRPRVCLLKRVVVPAETSRPSVKYVALCQDDSNCYTDTCTIDHMEIDLEDPTLQHNS